MHSTQAILHTIWLSFLCLLVSFYSSIHNIFPLWKTKRLLQHVMWAGTQWAMAVLRVWSFLLSISINKASSFPTPGDIRYLTSSYSAKTGIKQSPWDPSIAVSGKGQEERAQVAVYKWLLLWLNFNKIGQSPLLDNSQWLGFNERNYIWFLELGCLYWAKILGFFFFRMCILYYDCIDLQPFSRKAINFFRFFSLCVV